MPLINDPLYLGIAQDLDTTDGVVANSWETKLPTALTAVQSKPIALNIEGLPCTCDEGTENDIVKIDNILKPLRD